jgi:ferredoxin
MRALVDKAACCGYALCVEIFPEVYKMGSDAIVEILLEPVPLAFADKCAAPWANVRRPH